MLTRDPWPQWCDLYHIVKFLLVVFTIFGFTFSVFLYNYHRPSPLPKLIRDSIKIIKNTSGNKMEVRSAMHRINDTDSDNVTFTKLKTLQPPPTDPAVLEYLRRYHIKPPSSKLHYAKYPNRKFLESYHIQELRKLFRNQTRGFFVECGANDGEFLSNTLDLEINQNWTGLLIEADPELYEALMSKHRNAWISDVCLSPYYNITELEFRVSSKTANEFSQGEGYARTRGNVIENPFIQHRSYVFVKDVMVKCFPLRSLLTALNVTHVDYLSLDVQGLELAILKTLPFNDQLTIDYVHVEHELVPEGKYYVEKFMNRVGYNLVLDLGLDYVFKRR